MDHYGIRAMGAMTLRNFELCPSFSPHPNISDGNFNLDHHFSARKYSRYMKKGPVELRADEEDGESESKVTSQIFGCLQRPKKEVRYLKNIFFRL